MSSVSADVLSSSNPAEAILTMKLYDNVGARLKRELAERGFATDDSLQPGDLYPIDSMHYLGEAAVREAAAKCCLTHESSVLEVGSGAGGPSRLLAHEFNCSVVANELQPSLSETAEKLTRRCGLGDRVRHVAGDVLDPACDCGREHDAVVSFLCYLHIDDKPRLLDALRGKMKKGGLLYTEDFYALNPFTAEETQSLREDVFACDLPSAEEYKAILKSGGFELEEWTDVTAEWSAFVAERRAAYIASEARQLRVHGALAYEGMLHFFTAMDTLFKGGNLGGVRYKARLQ